MTPPLAKFFTGVILSPEIERSSLISALEEAWGRADVISPEFPFLSTDYYVREMGQGLIRFFVSFSPLQDPASLPRWKEEAALLEQKWTRNGARRVNLDPGYMDTFKVVLASFKEGGQKLYLGRGVWGDMTLQYRKGEWVPFPWTFPDFACGTYHAVLNEIRQKLKEENKLQHKC
ncbi:MAG TPA: DUF4416 family protein [Candidatus Mcinerneyibacteriales bacterium]|nr:DUF4416 family protein [Candidatus Mcinerneyibacteriales bacterium]